MPEMEYIGIRIIWFCIGFIVAIILARLELRKIDKAFDEYENYLWGIELDRRVDMERGK